MGEPTEQEKRAFLRWEIVRELMNKMYSIDYISLAPVLNNARDIEAYLYEDKAQSTKNV